MVILGMMIDLGACTVQAGVAYISGYRQCHVQNTPDRSHSLLYFYTQQRKLQELFPPNCFWSLINTIQRSPVCYLIWLRTNPRGVVSFVLIHFSFWMRLASLVVPWSVRQLVGWSVGPSHFQISTVLVSLDRHRASKDDRMSYVFQKL